MPNYNTPVKPVRLTKQSVRPPERRVYLDQQRDVARKLLGEDAASLSDAKDGLFYTDKFGKFHELKVSEPDYVMPFAKANCLYVRDRNNALHQIGLENNDGGISLNVSAPLQDAEPKRPSLWTYIKSIFVRSAREEIQAYQEAKAFNENFRALAKDEKHHIDPKPDMTAIPTEQIVEKAPEAKKAEGKKVEAKKPEEKKAEPLNPSKMTAERFGEHLKEVHDRGSAYPDKAILDKPANHTPDEYYEAVAQVLEGHVARNMLYATAALDDEKKGAFFDAQKREYTSLAAGLRDFVRTKIDGELVDRFFKERRPADRIQLTNRRMELEKTGVTEYIELVEAQNAANKAQQMQSNPNQAQMNQPEAQMQQAQSQMSVSM
jgi:hypothetical protein